MVHVVVCFPLLGKPSIGAERLGSMPFSPAKIQWEYRARPMPATPSMDANQEVCELLGYALKKGGLSGGIFSTMRKTTFQKIPYANLLVGSFSCA
ncbi:MAG: hypothetical protein HYV01_20785 [Deltaproteobacteria bacterium]|nr:hypothetical protein [Deltaproteobacteria bacterium]